MNINPPGPQPLIEVCAAVLCHQGKYLLAKRHADKHMGGRWEFPGGKIQAGESRAECIVREIEEEFGLTVFDPIYLTATEHRYPEKTVRLHFLQCNLAPEARLVCREHQAADWFTPAEITRLNLAAADHEFAHSLV